MNITLTEEGKKVAANPKEHPLSRGSAVLVKSSMYAMAANLQIFFNKPKHPFKAFTDKKEALDWLLKQPLLLLLCPFFYLPDMEWIF